MKYMFGHRRTSMAMSLAAFAQVCSGCLNLPAIADPTDTVQKSQDPNLVIDPNGARGASGIITTSAQDPTPSVAGPQPSLLLPGLSVQNGNILDSNGASVALHGVTWPGFETTADMVVGFPQSNALVGDFSTVARRMYLMGFNSVRLPFSFKELLGTQVPPAINGPCTPAFNAAVAASVAPPGAPVGKVYDLPEPAAPTPGRCNDYVPGGSAIARFTWVVQFLAHNGFYVVLVNDLQVDDTAVTNPFGWAANWNTLLSEIGTEERVRQHLLVDLLNEPDSEGLTWVPHNQAPGLAALYLVAMDNLHALNPNLFFMVQGTGQGGLGANWGDGFCTDAKLVRDDSLSDASPFFQALRSKPYANRVIVAPQVFSPDVTFSGTASLGPALYGRLTHSFGYLSQAGFCQGGACTRYLTVIGSLGSGLSQGDSVQTMNDLAQYMTNTGTGADGLHQSIPNWFYSAWDINGVQALLAGGWDSPAWNKVKYLQGLGLTAQPPPP